MKLVNFNLEEALANPERVVCVTEEVKLVKWQYFEDIHKEGFEFPIAIWFDINGAKAYSASSTKGVCIRGVDYNLMLKAQKKTIPFCETLLGKEGVRVISKRGGTEVFFKYKSDKLSYQPFVFEYCDCNGNWVLFTKDLMSLEDFYVMEVDEG